MDKYNIERWVYRVDTVLWSQYFLYTKVGHRVVGHRLAGLSRGLCPLPNSPLPGESRRVVLHILLLTICLKYIPVFVHVHFCVCMYVSYKLVGRSIIIIRRVFQLLVLVLHLHSRDLLSFKCKKLV